MANRREVPRSSKQQKEERLKALKHYMTILTKFYYSHTVLTKKSLHKK